MTQTDIPLLTDLRRKPRLQFLDTGLLNYGVGLQTELLPVSDLNVVYHGILSEHIVAQEFMSRDTAVLTKPIFWVREAKQASAEVDFVVQYRDRLVPVEVKSGKTGTLRSLHSFLDISRRDFAVRLYSGNLKCSESRTPGGTSFRLLDLPYFLAARIEEYIEAYI